MLAVLPTENWGECSVNRPNRPPTALLIRNAAAIVTIAARMHACIVASMRKNTYANGVSLVYPERIDADDGGMASAEQ